MVEILRCLHLCGFAVTWISDSVVSGVLLVWIDIERGDIVDVL